MPVSDSVAIIAANYNAIPYFKGGINIHCNYTAHFFLDVTISSFLYTYEPSMSLFLQAWRELLEACLQVLLLIEWPRSWWELHTDVVLSNTLFWSFISVSSQLMWFWILAERDVLRGPNGMEILRQLNGCWWEINIDYSDLHPFNNLFRPKCIWDYLYWQ